MGCDIHGWVERRVPIDPLGIFLRDREYKWVAVSEFKWLPTRSRNYKRFTRLASVRGVSTCKPRGVPGNVSETVRYHINEKGADGHSHSYMSLVMAAQIWLQTDPEPSFYNNNHPESAYFDVEVDAEYLKDFRVVFWFDN